jgi:RNA polymerase sigma factor (sigma-70 family)
VRRSLTLRSSRERTFESLYERNVRDIYRYTFAVLGSSADAEDVTQTTFLNAYRAIERGERPRQPQHWLRAIAHNLCRQHFRRASRRREVALEQDVEELVPDEQSPSVEDLIRALKHLPFSQRSALVMREFEGRSLEEIAATLEVSQSAVETLLFRARRSLREQLEEGLTCLEAEHAISSQLDGVLPRRERGALRAHLRECDQCAALARRLRAQRGAMKSLAILPLPASLAWSSPWGAGTAAGTASGAAALATAGGSSVLGSVIAKVAVGAAAAAALGGISYEAVSQHVLSTGGSRPGAAHGAQHVGATGSSAEIAKESTRHGARVSRADANRGRAAAAHAGHRGRGRRTAAAPSRKHIVATGSHPHGKRSSGVATRTGATSTGARSRSASAADKSAGHSRASSPAVETTTRAGKREAGSTSYQSGSGGDLHTSARVLKVR